MHRAVIYSCNENRFVWHLRCDDGRSLWKQMGRKWTRMMSAFRRMRSGDRCTYSHIYSGWFNSIDSKLRRDKNPNESHISQDAKQIYDSMERHRHWHRLLHFSQYFYSFIALQSSHQFGFWIFRWAALIWLSIMGSAERYPIVGLSISLIRK